MATFLNLVLIGIAVFGAAHGASVGSKAKECSIADGYFAMSCGARLQDFSAKIKELDIDDPNEMKEFKKSCDAMDNCFNNMCKEITEDTDVKNAFVATKAYCGLINHATGAFKPCADKLETKNSKCYEDWDPFLEEEDLKDEKKREEACKNFFGKDQCIKKEVTELCGQKEWESLRDTFINFNEGITKQCNMKQFLN